MEYYDVSELRNQRLLSLEAVRAVMTCSSPRYRLMKSLKREATYSDIDLPLQTMPDIKNTKVSKDV